MDILGELYDVLIYVIVYGCVFGIPISFVVFLILALVQIPKVKRKEKRPTKLIVFGILSSVFLFELVIEILLIIYLAMGIAHM